MTKDEVFEELISTIEGSSKEYIKKNNLNVDAVLIHNVSLWAKRWREEYAEASQPNGKTAEEILIKYLLALPNGNIEDYQEAQREEPEAHNAILKAMEEYASEFQQGYPKEFVEWLHFKNHQFIAWRTSQEYYFTDGENNRRWTLDELYEYWQNLKDK